MDNFVKSYGAKGDGICLDTIPIQKAIDLCNENGGGRVIFEGGIFLSGTLWMRSNVELYFDTSATLLASPDINDYSEDTHYQLYRNEKHMDKCFIFCHKVNNIGFSGQGTIDGNGGKFSSNPGCAAMQRPMLVRYLDCTNIRISNIRMINPASWTNAFISCKNIWINNITIYSRINWNGDGLDFDACENVFINSCNLDCSDDCICLQNSEESQICKNIFVTNTIMSSQWAGMRIGLLSCGNIENVAVSNCMLKGIECSGIKIQSSEGGELKYMSFENLIMENVQRPVFISQNYHRERIGRQDIVNRRGNVSDIIFKNVIASMIEDGDSAKSCIIIDAEDFGGISNISFFGLRYSVPGGVSSVEWTDLDSSAHINKRAECFNYNSVRAEKLSMKT
jgi:polygalacturonase